MSGALEQLKRAFHGDNATLVREILAAHPEFQERLNAPLFDFASPAITHVRSREMLEVLLEAGANLNAKSQWEPGGFGLLHLAPPDVALHAIALGAEVDIHAAARLNLVDRIRELLTASPALVHARGGDGQTPLHFAGSVAVAEYLLDHGAEIDARDVDHESTPAQYCIRDRQDILRYLIRRGCTADIFMAAALGDEALASRLLQEDSSCTGMRVSEEYFPMVGGKSGGTIYQWALGWHVSPHDVARNFGHPGILRRLLEFSSPETRFIDFCWQGDSESARSLLLDYPSLAGDLSPAGLRQTAHAARNNNTAAVRAMLAAGLPVNSISQHGATLLHWAAFHGNAAMAEEILTHAPELEVVDQDFHSTPTGWALHGSEHGWHRDTGDYPATLDLLLNAGAKLPAEIRFASPAVREFLKRRNPPA